MKYLVKFIVITFLVFGINNSFAEEKIIYIDMDRIVNKSKAGVFISNELRKIHQKNMENFQNTEDKLRKEEADLLSKKNVMNKEEFQEKIKLLRERAKKFQSERGKRLEEIRKIRTNATKTILETLQPLIAEYSDKNNISIVIDKKNVIIGKTDLDITELMISKLNKKLPSIKLN